MAARTGHFEREEVGEPALARGLGGERVRAQAVRVLLLAAHLKRGGEPVRRVAHHLVRAVLGDRRNLHARGGQRLRERADLTERVR